MYLTVLNDIDTQKYPTVDKEKYDIKMFTFIIGNAGKTIKINC